MKNLKHPINKAREKETQLPLFRRCFECGKIFRTRIELYPLCNSCWASNHAHHGYRTQVSGGKMVN